MRSSSVSIWLLVIAIATAPASVHSADVDGAEVPTVPGQAVLEPPPPPPQNYNPPTAPEIAEPEFEPEVTITTKGAEIHEEYRVNGQLYRIKVTPAKGKPYYLIDEVGNGKFRRSDVEPQFLVPVWVIKTF